MQTRFPRRRTRRRRAACLLTLLCALASPITPADPNGTLDTLRVPRPAPDFSLPGTDGRQHGLEDFRGRYLLVNFWAIWCQPCRKEMPSMERLYRELREKNFEILAIHAGPSLDRARHAANELGVTFPVAVDEDIALSAWRVRGLPTSYLLDPRGNIVARAVGERQWDSPAMRKALELFLSAGAGTEALPLPVAVASTPSGRY